MGQSVLFAKKTLGYINIIYCDQNSKVAFFHSFSLVSRHTTIVTQAYVIKNHLVQVGIRISVYSTS